VFEEEGWEDILCADSGYKSGIIAIMSFCLCSSCGMYLHDV
jgi:hypothetical protein